MSTLDPSCLALLQRNLSEKYLPHLPPLLKQDKSADQLEKKNLSRAFSAFALHHLTGISEREASQAVVDDFDDLGLDAIYYYAPSETVYLIQSKLKASAQFSQDEALAYCQGIRKLIKQDFDGFNQHVIKRQVEIEDALDNCSVIQLVIAHTGSGISSHAKFAVEELLHDDTHGEERLKSPAIDYDAAQVVRDLQTSQAYTRVDTPLVIRKCSRVTEPRTTYFGLACVADLVALHKKHGRALYDKNIRTYLGQATEVNASIQRTLAEKPDHFLYLNNGVTVLCEKIESKSTKADRKRLVIDGFSVVNGAQTIASSAKFAADNPTANIEDARVSITLIQADSDGEFGKSVTRARNHQNPVLLANFVALHDEQERLRRDLAHLDIHYAYKEGIGDGLSDANCIRADEAIYALALFHSDPRYVVWLKKEPSSLLDTSSDRYKALFTSSLTAYQLANAVRFARYISARMAPEARGSGAERLTYKHGVHAFGWILAKRVQREQNCVKLFDSEKLRSQLSTPSDLLRQKLWDTTQLALGNKSPLGIFRGQAHAIPLIIRILVEYFGLSGDAAVPALQMQQHSREQYPEKLVNYLISKAPQIESLT